MFTCFCSSCNAASFPICMFLFFSLSSGIWRLRSFGLSNPTKGKGQGKGGIRDRFGFGKRNFGSSEGQLCRTSYCLLLCFFLLRKAKTNNKTRLSKVVRPSQQQKTVLSPGGLVLSLAVFLFVFLASASLVIHTDGAQACFFFFPTKREI